MAPPPPTRGLSVCSLTININQVQQNQSVLIGQIWCLQSKPTLLWWERLSPVKCSSWQRGRLDWSGKHVNYFSVG